MFVCHDSLQWHRCVRCVSDWCRRLMHMMQHSTTDCEVHCLDVLTGQTQQECCLQEHFLRSSRPLEALSMRRQAQQWGLALELACALDLGQVGELSFLQAQVQTHSLQASSDCLLLHFSYCMSLHARWLLSHLQVVAASAAVVHQVAGSELQVDGQHANGGQIAVAATAAAAACICILPDLYLLTRPSC